jgi:hypothetical protein
MSKFLPDPHGCCPVCKESWDAGAGRSKVIECYYPTRIYLTTDDGSEDPITGYQCPFCQTEWEA